MIILLVWGGIAIALLAGAVAAVLTVRWRRRTIAELRSEQLAADGRPSAGRSDTTS
ncbi:hypothetical protein QMZ92_09120 [Streptomyces sp. HNM0645]|uniref:hypothetical protein n=1 Tax=Streptomyces sp. HNM0645 TaxID=2782343 RepID=UPI0024B6DE68|nr:hypothetical protein [Streptomyces sp. HNM0645]MDI9884556.1 hypothetical protein [Streptomyces sp. HNM0645]